MKFSIDGGLCVKPTTKQQRRCERILRQGRRHHHRERNGVNSYRLIAIASTNFCAPVTQPSKLVQNRRFKIASQHAQ